MIDAQAVAVPSRRGFVAGALALLAAPVVVKAASLMKVAPTEIIRPPVIGGSLRVGDVLCIRLPNDYVVTDGPGLLDIQGPAEEVREFVITSGAERRTNLLMQQNEITRDAVRLFKNSNAFIEEMNRQYEAEFDYINGVQWVESVAPPIDKLALAVAAPVVVAKALEQPVTRRFWKR